MLKTMLATIEDEGLIAPGETVLVAVSGGPDSVALFEGLLRLRGRLSFSIHAAHLNHRLRGWDSDEDERFVRNLAERHRVPLIVEARDVKRIQKRRGGSLEEVARDVRYAFLRRAAGRCRATKIALGHNMDDNAETFLMNLIRGSGGKGLSGMPLARKEAKFTIIRPLLGVTRAEILSFLEKEKLSYRADVTNQDTTLTRNRIRHCLLPLLAKEYNPRIKRVLVTTGHHLRQAEECLSAVTAELEKDCLRQGRGKISVRIDRLRLHAPVLGQEFLRRAVAARLGVSMDAGTLGKIWQLVKGTRTESVGLGKGLVACREYDQLLFVPESTRRARPFEKKLQIPCDVFLAELGVQISTSYVEKKKTRVPPRRRPPLGEIWQRARRGQAQDFEEFFDASAIHGNCIVVRTRREGDAVCPIGMRGTKKVKELFIDEKLPVTLRDKVPIFCAGDEIMWIVGHRPAAKFAVKESSQKVLRLQVKVLYCPE